MKKGWVKSIRNVKGITFLNVTDGSGDFQITLKETVPVTGELKVGASFESKGYDSVTPNDSYEFVATSLTIIGTADDTFPIQPKAHTMDYLRTIPDLRGRTKTFQAVWRIRHHLTQAIHSALSTKGFFQFYTPIITSADCEGAGETFDAKTDWMEEKLTVSGQLHGEVGMMSLGKIYTFSPCFRAEKSATKKHLAEFWMVEPEIAFSKLDETVEFTETFLRRVIADVSISARVDFKLLKIESDDLLEFARKKWVTKTYDEIVEEFELPWGADISTETEKKISEKYGVPVFVTKYPKDIKPFYMKKDDKYAYCFDLIFPVVGELVGGSEREESYEVLKSEMEKSGLDMEKMQWYLNTRKWGTVPHSGFGLGFERLLLYLTKMDKIHDVIPFPVSY